MLSKYCYIISNYKTSKNGLQIINFEFFSTIDLYKSSNKSTLWSRLKILILWDFPSNFGNEVSAKYLINFNSAFNNKLSKVWGTYSKCFWFYFWEKQHEFCLKWNFIAIYEKIGVFRCPMCTYESFSYEKW